MLVSLSAFFMGINLRKNEHFSLSHIKPRAVFPESKFPSVLFLIP